MFRLRADLHFISHFPVASVFQKNPEILCDTASLIIPKGLTVLQHIFPQRYADIQISFHYYGQFRSCRIFDKIIPSATGSLGFQSHTDFRMYLYISLLAVERGGPDRKSVV